MSQRITLAENAGAGNGTAKTIERGGKFTYMAEGTWGGGSAKLQLQSPNGTWVDVASGSLAANGTLSVDLPAGQVRLVIATSSAVYAYLTRCY